jgi:hypothetical protein
LVLGVVIFIQDLPEFLELQGRYLNNSIFNTENIFYKEEESYDGGYDELDLFYIFMGYR